MKFISILFLLIGSVFGEIINTWENIDYAKVVDLSKSFVKERHIIKAINTGSEPASTYYFAIPKNVSESIAFSFASTIDASKNEVPMDSHIDEIEGGVYSVIQLPFPIAPKSKVSFAVSLVITNQLEPFPRKQALGDIQNLVLTTNKAPYSAYPTKSYKIRFQGPSSAKEVKTIGATDPFGWELKSLEGGFSYDVTEESFAPYTESPVSLVYERNLPLPYVKDLRRDLWLSPRLNTLQVEEHYDYSNKAAELISGFSRADWMNKRMSTKSSPAITAIHFPLYKGVEIKDIYFTDLVGNVSTSLVMENNLIVKPRFPIFGNWNYNFTVGWTHKLSDFLREDAEDKDEYLLEVPLIGGSTDVVYEKVELSFYLPEGAEFISVQSPLANTDYSISEVYSYLDIFGSHTKVTLQFENLVVDLRNVKVGLKYRYTLAAYLRKPIYIGLSILVALLSYLGITKIDLSLSK
ncbi:ER oligosaccharyltransferase complex subunit alpha [Komagataella phaffii CBS 7435]|uniref:Dolichyl-diphosphooligosaccharide--protein glycosyltransferase subunit 1 n=2 Tax=Komagataella phaffii TaxID=460519 RepID=C4R5F4_KOMPG|nr:Alpha subunit of the oligosaccharyltransferase complex of the ER lumen [Komagataella phaffii GS115]AOA64242.1 GQ67_03838T0 [Komagataella phaffii]CAH2449426.1 ER oligosaccharyltransferase complex subunit alpha [Komagataella phaffii CBS 7435]AOA69312.1 GQ68_03811T0 [Komagataella phaffii GS115]CAY70790.1 Alpha subunit of the oligosaccharyltransferase complex of the ER lumen [Komagataella phaffii GS115]CCA39413.1 ER oligosaccharyltransferase complex subunit alpha [Komagataella phaffii CBS 7435]